MGSYKNPVHKTAKNRPKTDFAESVGHANRISVFPIVASCPRNGQPGCCASAGGTINYTFLKTPHEIVLSTRGAGGSGEGVKAWERLYRLLTRDHKHTGLLCVSAKEVEWQ